MVGSIVGTNNPLKGEVMGSVNVNQCLENGKVLNTVIMQTIRKAVAEHIERGAECLVDLNTPARVKALLRMARVHVTMTNVPRDDWEIGTWFQIQRCLDFMPDEASAYKEHALDYVDKQLERLDF